MNELKLRDLLPIEIWIKIAECVQKFNISSGNDKEKEKNYNSLNKFLNQRGYNLNKEEGLRLINAIYNLDCDINYKKAYFYEQIITLKDLKVNNISFNDNIKNIIKLTDKNKKSILQRSAYTDGIFNVRKWEDNGFKYYSILNLEDYNYIIIKTIFIDENRLDRVDIYLKDFNGNYPAKKEIIRFKQAKLLKIKKKLYKEKYDLFNRDEISCKQNMNLKLGKKQKNNQYYYEK